MRHVKHFHIAFSRQTRDGKASSRFLSLSTYVLTLHVPYSVGKYDTLRPFACATHRYGAQPRCDERSGSSPLATGLQLSWHVTILGPVASSASGYECVCLEAMSRPSTSQAAHESDRGSCTRSCARRKVQTPSSHARAGPVH